MKNLKVKLIGLFCIVFFNYTFAQHKVEVLAKVSQSGSKITLRWVPSSPALWKLANQQTTGYQIKKFKVYANGTLLAAPQLVTGYPITLKVPDFSFQDVTKRNVWFTKFMHSSTWSLTPEQFNSNAYSSPGLVVNDEYATLWSAIYGDISEASTTKDGLVDISIEADKRFNAALSICDYNFEAARFVGLGYTDSLVVAGEKYLYEVTPMVTGITVTKGSVYIGIDDKEDLSKIPPYEANVVFVDSVAKINWNTSLLDNFYSSYDVLKSTDGIDFNKINTKPLLKIGNDAETSLTYVDSLHILPVPPSKERTLSLTNTYYYKVVGRTPFGEEGKASDIISGKVRLFLHESPYISSAEIDIKNKEDKAIVKFTFPPKLNPAVNKFLVSYSTTSSSTGYTYLSDFISPNGSGVYEKKVSAIAINQTTFFRVSAIPFHGDQQDSNPEMVEPIDSIPPLAPTIVSVVEDGRILKDGDSLIIAKITWTIDTTVVPNTDIDGYRLFRSQNPNEEPSQITNGDNIPKNRFVWADTVSYYTFSRNFAGLKDTTKYNKGTNSLNTKVFYRIRALDKRENQGPLSAKKFLRKPDKVPLPPVVIGDYNMGDDGIGISWSPYVGVDSFYVDFDFSKMTVFRAEIPKDQITAISHGSSTASWVFLGDVFDPIDSSYFDIQVLKGKTYAYCVVTTDLSNNKSYSMPFIIEYKPKSNLSTTEPGITTFTSEKLSSKNYVKLNWAHTSTNVVEYVLLRATSSLDDLSRYKILENTEKEFFDLDIKAGSTYKYGIMANYADGTHSILVKSEVTF